MTLNEYTVEEIKKILPIVREQRFLMLKGPTGTGKTLYAHALACMLAKEDKNLFGDHTIFKNNSGEPFDSVYYGVDIRGKFNGFLNDQVRNVVFQKGTRRENFVYGTVAHTENSKIVFQNEKQVFLQAVEAAQKGKSKNYVLILDDIGRADFSEVMGDILSALEPKDAGHTIHADKKYQIPQNLYIIATYNPAVANSTVDYAWFRRFYVYEMNADERHIIKSRETIWQNNTVYQLFNAEGEMSIDPKGFANFKNMDPYQKLMDYVYVVFMHVKILFEKYSADPNVRDMYIPGHGMFLTYDPSKNYQENIDKFHNQLRHVIVPLLYHCLHSGLLDERAAFDIDLLAHLWDKDYGTISHTKKATGNYKPQEIEILDKLNNHFPASVTYFFFLRNPLLMRIDHAKEHSYFLFAKDEPCEIYFDPRNRNNGSEENYHLAPRKNGKKVAKMVISDENSNHHQVLWFYDCLNRDNAPKQKSKKEAEDYAGDRGQVYSPQIFFKYLKVAIMLLEIGCAGQSKIPDELLSEYYGNKKREDRINTLKNAFDKILAPISQEESSPEKSQSNNL